MKICKKCNFDKNNDEFYKHKSVCIPCYLEGTKKWRVNNKEIVKKNSRKSYLKNKELRREPRRKYAVEKRKSDKLYATRSSISRLIRMSFRNNNFKKNNKSELILGCSFEEFRIYLESKFESWMNWENRGLYNGSENYGWDIDHIIPVASAKTEEEIVKLNHYTNLQPLCSKINRDIKKDKIESNQPSV
jgi:hypothetical protein